MCDKSPSSGICVPGLYICLLKLCIKLRHLGIPWPKEIASLQKHASAVKEPDDSFNGNACTYFTLSNNKYFHNYKDFVAAEVKSLFLNEKPTLISPSCSSGNISDTSF